MNQALKWKLIAGFLLVFIAGGVTGAFFAATAARSFLFASRHTGLVADHMRDRLQRELRLTPDQVSKISPIVDKTGAELEDIRRYSGRRVRETFMESHEQISKYLTEEQRTELKKIETRHRRWHGAFGGPHHDMDGAPDTDEAPSATTSASPE